MQKIIILLVHKNFRWQRLTNISVFAKGFHCYQLFITKSFNPHSVLGEYHFISEINEFLFLEAFRVTRHSSRQSSPRTAFSISYAFRKTFCRGWQAPKGLVKKEREVCSSIKVPHCVCGFLKIMCQTVKHLEDIAINS